MFNELERIKDHKMLVFDLVTNRYKADKVSQAERTALESAVRALEEQRGETQDGRILAYIARNAPYSWLYRDEYTMRALKAGLTALQRKEEVLERICKETNSQYRDDCRLSMTT